jgi:formylmethanofuran dehydrogenase subunit C
MCVSLSLKKTPNLPVEAESLVPVNVAGKSDREIGSLPLLVGNRWETVGDWFRVNVEAPEDDDEQDGRADLLLRGDLTRFKRLGEGMTEGRMVVEGPVGFHAGVRMSGGSLVIHGDASDYLGAHMSGGTLVVHGNAGHYAAASYRGETHGMKGGTLIVTGSAGQMLGARMRRGLIYVLGDCGDVPGFNMKAGTILVGGRPGVRVGARMVRGTVVLLGGAPEMLPTFFCSCTCQPPIWRVLHTHLAGRGFRPDVGAEASFRLYSGDLNEGGKGEVLVCAEGASESVSRV